MNNNFENLSANAQRVFVNIERILWRYRAKEMKITKEDLAWECVMSIPGIKVALRELKDKGFIKSKNNNSPILSINEEHEWKDGK